MKTTLNFEAPSDLSVGTVRIQNSDQSIADWIATPDNRTFSTEDVSPGIYWAEVTPAGLAPQSVFNVEEEKLIRLRCHHFLPYCLREVKSASLTQISSKQRQWFHRGLPLMQRPSHRMRNGVLLVQRLRQR